MASDGTHLSMVGVKIQFNDSIAETWKQKCLVDPEVLT